jgi:hypothetical protein
VGQVKKEGEGVKLGGGQTCVDIGGLVVSSSKPSAGFGGFVLKTISAVGGLGLKTIGGRVYGFGPQNPGGRSEEERTTRGDIEEFASRQSYLMKGAVTVG